MSESFQLDLRLYNDLKIPLITLEHWNDDFISDVSFDDLCNWSIAYLYNTKYDGVKNINKVNDFIKGFELCYLSCNEVYDTFFETEIKGETKTYNTKKMFEEMLENLNKKTEISRDYLFNYCVYRFTLIYKPLVFRKFNCDHEVRSFILKRSIEVRVNHDN